MYLERIASPADMKALPVTALPVLAEEMRAAHLERVSHHGGHVGPNLGVTELTIALHRVFTTPVDKIVYDVSHQTYMHKMLTGRVQAFLDPTQYDAVTGYTDPTESEHDFFNIGHTSTSISLASGLAKARDLQGEKHNVVAVIGDGSLSGGEALEGLDFVGAMDTNFIVIVNDNDMSIAENHGGLYKSLHDLRTTNGASPNNIFKAFGLDYRFVADGHDIEGLMAVLESVNHIDHPVVVHVVTTKGKGYALAEEHKEDFHYAMPFDLKTGQLLDSYDGPSYNGIVRDVLTDAMKQDPAVFTVNAATPGGFGFTKEWRDAVGDQYVDVGIAEEQAVAMISGAAKGGAKPVFTVYSTFIQRTYDQLVQDLSVNNNSALILTYLASVYGINDITHLGFFDIPMMSHIPNLVYLAPTTKEELEAMMRWGIEQDEHPVAIRVPVGPVISTGVVDTTDYSQLNRFAMSYEGEGVAIIGLGNFYHMAHDAWKELQTRCVNATLINPKFITGLDTDMLDGLLENHHTVITVEDGVVSGGFGQTIASYYGPTTMRVHNLGLSKAFPDRYDAATLLREDGVTVEHIVELALAK